MAIVVQLGEPVFFGEEVESVLSMVDGMIVTLKVMTVVIVNEMVLIEQMNHQ